MKLQGLAIIFVIIILPITLIIGEYANTQITIFRKEQLYDSRLITATYDSLKAFQINTFNDAYSDNVDKKIDSIEAAVNAFYNSMETGFGLEGYSKAGLQQFVPALVYTMYDGYYIYSPYTNVAKPDEEEQKLEINLNSVNIDYGLKPYVYYSCRYEKPGIDVVINYSLDNYITVQGIVNGEKVYKSGYLVTLASSNTSEGLYRTKASGTYKYTYNGIDIPVEYNKDGTKQTIVDTLVEKDGSTKQYKYIKLNGTKYYLDTQEKNIFYISGGNRVVQVSENLDPETYGEYSDKIENNTSAQNYYASAYKFTKWVNDKLGDLQPKHAVDNKGEQLAITPFEDSKIFENYQIEYAGSNFNLHKKEVIRHSIESNLSVAIANFNSYSSTTTTNLFQMPKLTDNDWNILQNEVSIISFLQGLNLGGKIYNGYSVVANSKTEELVKEERICIATNDGYYHRINDNHLSDTGFKPDTVVAAYLDSDMEIRKNLQTGTYYTQKKYLGCYTSVVEQTNVNNKYDSIYEYLYNYKQDHYNEKYRVLQCYYTALGRERFGTYKIENSSNITTMLENMNKNLIEED